MFLPPLYTDTLESYDNELEPPSTLLWTQAYLAQHYDYLSDYQTALGFVEEAIEATPTLPELHMIKGRIYKVCVESNSSERITFHCLGFSQRQKSFWFSCVIFGAAVCPCSMPCKQDFTRLQIIDESYNIDTVT